MSALENKQERLWRRIQQGHDDQQCYVIHPKLYPNKEEKTTGKEEMNQPKEATEKNKEDGQFTKQKTKKIEGNGNMKEENQKKCGVRNLRNKQMST